MSRSEYGWLFSQNRSSSWTSVARPYGVDSQALTMTLSSSGESTGRAPSARRRVKKSFHDVKPQYSSSESYWQCSMPIARLAAAPFQPDGESSTTQRESPLLRNVHHPLRIFLSISVIRLSRKA